MHVAKPVELAELLSIVSSIVQKGRNANVSERV
jgi:hypothetical protein